MVAITRRFALLAALSSIAAVSALPPAVRGELIRADEPHPAISIAARHSVRGKETKAAVDDNRTGDTGTDREETPKDNSQSDSSGTKDRPHTKPVLPLPTPLVSHAKAEATGSLHEKGGKIGQKHHSGSREDRANERRETYSIDPMTRMRSLWVGGGAAARDIKLETLPPRLDKRHHHHHHNHGPDKVIVKGHDDHVNLHDRSFGSVVGRDHTNDHNPVVVERSIDQVHVRRSPSPRHHHHHSPDTVVIKGDNDHVHARREPSPHHRHHPDKVVVEGDNDHVHLRRSPVPHHRHRRPDKVIVQGSDDHVHARREPSPHHHHHLDKVVVEGDNDHVHLRRSPAPRHRHQRPDKVIVKGSDDHVRIHRSPHHHNHPEEVVVKGDHDRVHVHRRSFHRRHHQKAIIKGNNQHVHLGRSPAPAPEPHHRHHSDKVVVKGDHDHVDVHRKRSRDYRQPIVIPGNRGKAYLIAHKASTGDIPLANANVGVGVNIRRDTGMAGVPGMIDIMSQVADSPVGQRVASLVLAASGDDASSGDSPFVLNASDTDRTEMYMVPASSTNNTSANSATSGTPAAPSPSTLSADAVTAGPDITSFVKVLLQMPIFEAASAEMKPYCATFDPRPSAPAPMTVESCMNATSSDPHKSQTFAYEPATGIIRPMWYQGEDDGTSSDSTPSPSGSTAGSSPSASSTDDSSTPVSNKVADVTSFEQEAVDGEFGDSTHSPMPVPKTLSAQALGSAQNVTLMFSPMAAEVLPDSPVGKLAVQPSGTDSSSASATTDSGSDTLLATVSATFSSATSAPTSESVADPLSSASTTDASATDTDTGSSSVVTAEATSTSSATSSDSASSVSSTSGSGLTATATPPAALEVKVYNPYVEDTADSVSTIGTDSGASTTTDPSPTSTMTPVSTAPYEWMFSPTTSAR
ncbi:hypothetical protein BD309DRAFT_773493 [Dichomitus squalens]|uniref:Uncharacterized protein n=1 Tax=Dichomitus squalens TaxID=114155 RepID=A0A4Q9NSP1_9APHY|nr:hypothetical protein BD309DRAFT_773493 [Dichomitus squalens]TBU59529.1 hypothetical protein BD310DRAFT_409601 [Dichomitus squalens]